MVRISPDLDHTNKPSVMLEALSETRLTDARSITSQGSWCLICESRP